MWNLALLLVIGPVPWSTSLAAAYLRHEHGSHLAAVVYVGVFLVLTAVFYAMQRHILLGPGELALDELEQEQKRYIDRRPGSASCRTPWPCSPGSSRRT